MMMMMVVVVVVVVIASTKRSTVHMLVTFKLRTMYNHGQSIRGHMWLHFVNV
jgi:hypothetical protein